MCYIYPYILALLHSHRGFRMMVPLPLQVREPGKFAMPATCENWLDLVYICVYLVRQTHEIYQVLPYSVYFKLLKSFEIHWVSQYLVNVVLFGIKDL